MITLGVNIDHVATVRNARGIDDPDPVIAAGIVELAGADCITIHLREDRRHICDRDLELLSKVVKSRLNLEMAPTEEMQSIALKYQPYSVTLVPEKRQELTTEGGLDVYSNKSYLEKYVKPFIKSKIIVSMFIDPDSKQIDATLQTNASHIELHTGEYANAKDYQERKNQLNRLKEAAIYAHSQGLHINAGHGLNYNNLEEFLDYVPYLEELNIGHSIIARSLYVGLDKAVRDMLELIKPYNLKKTIFQENTSDVYSMS